MQQAGNRQFTKTYTYNRRSFLGSVLAASGLVPVLLKPETLQAGPTPVAETTLTVRQVIDLIVAEIPGAPFKQTVDTIKAGDPEQQVSGIVTTMFATDEVITKTAGLGANFIIAHEPSFYSHLDETGWLQTDDVYKYKSDLLANNKIAIWRFHDYIHAHRPDGVLMGVLQAMGWDRYYDEKDPHIISIPPSSLESIARLAKQKLGISKLKLIGDLSSTCKRIALSPGAAGGRPQIETIRREKPDLFICGELNEWETSEYIRDLRYMGTKTSLLVLGHAVSEEPGMEWLVNWLRPKVPGIRITHIPSKDPFTWF